MEKRGKRAALLSESYCLNTPAHEVPPELLFCPTCQALRQGAIIESFQVYQLLGRGRSGMAYAALHPQTQQSAVLKLIPEHRAHRQFWDAARREAYAVNSWRQPTILTLFHCNIWRYESSQMGVISPAAEAERKMTYLLVVRQYAPFSLVDLLSYLGRGEMTMVNNLISEPLQWMRMLIQELGEALTRIHEHGISHGALVPGNILLAQNTCWLSDFGVSSLFPPPAPYYAPEQQDGIRRVLQERTITPFWNIRSPQADQYALAVLYDQLCALLLPQYSQRLAPVLGQARRAYPQERFASIALFTQALLTRLQVQNVPAQPIHNPPQQVSERPLDWEEAGSQAFRAHDYPQAIEAYRKALMLKPEDAFLWGVLGDSYFAMQEYDDAIDAYDHSLKYAPREAAIWWNRGTALEALGRRAEARASYDRSIQLQDS